MSGAGSANSWGRLRDRPEIEYAGGSSRDPRHPRSLPPGGLMIYRRAIRVEILEVLDAEEARQRSRELIAVAVGEPLGTGAAIIDPAHRTRKVHRRWNRIRLSFCRRAAPRSAPFKECLPEYPGRSSGSAAIKAAVEDSGYEGRRIDEVIMGCVLSAGLGQAPARQAALGAGLPASIPATTLNKMCGSAMRAVMLASDQILAGSAPR